MGVYQFKREQTFNQPIERLWDFISDPKNLKKITPTYMGFDITSENLPDDIYEGMIISYKVSPLLGIKTTWITEITHIQHQKYFVDEQRVGPYKLWHHQHFLESTPQGTVMSDIVTYQPPFGILGSLANSILIKKKLEEIFDHRFKIMAQLFGN
ncbi:ligand-binding SRPBCC domain-containing protein [Algoriphagus ratkowskyi]|uniref:Ligand-binding SRPBCC domain-containing protein n=1 Tax=Algoriphagus ratkowskyi TaxID=57028 RepID=A0A2W7R9X2_9BACT|nr:SRPBCC family protein [Algoriphagus ratkowskyi]PZX55936.1 ligand-binding SRPBCC domain-containing protein [Algoriphagus ratkowskyi]TXD77250.1 SRPBCC family protein [Algoriphagus ratkowskyi]